MNFKFIKKLFLLSIIFCNSFAAEQSDVIVREQLRICGGYDRYPDHLAMLLNNLNFLNIELTDRLIERHGINLNIENARGNLLHEVAARRNVVVLKFLLNTDLFDKNEKINEFGHGPYKNTPLHCAVGEGFQGSIAHMKQTVQLLLQNGADKLLTDQHDQTPEQLARQNWPNHGIAEIISDWQPGFMQIDDDSDSE